jgi:hypothetical protein
MQIVDAKVKYNQQSKSKKHRKGGKEDGQSVAVATGRQRQHGNGDRDGNSNMATAKVMAVAAAAVVAAMAMAEGNCQNEIKGIVGRIVPIRHLLSQ